MTVKLKPVVLLILAAVLVAGCATRQPPKPSKKIGKADVVPPLRPSRNSDGRTIAVAPRASASIRSGLSAGSRYRASRITGDYAGYPALQQFIDHMISRHGFSREYLNGVFSQAKRKQWTLDYLGKESGTAGPPRPGAWSRYRSKFLTEKHISSGTAFWRRYAAELDRASTLYGVPPEYILGIMGVETIYGANVGNHRVIDALTTLSFDYPRRGQYFQTELEKFLLMTRDERVDPSQPVGSYAGAMGLGQFMPSSFLQWAVDFDGDNHRDLWNPVDAIGSIANYFAAHGWRPGEPVVTAARGGAMARNLESGFDTRYSLAALSNYGIQPVAASLDSDSTVRLLRLSADSGDEYWLGHQNFYVITRYNHSTHYAMAVHQLAQAIKRRYFESVASLQ
ncbi:lytic murein transglycosylase B [Methylocaldum sp. MU1018]